MVVEGELQIRGEIGGEIIVIPLKTGEVTGALPYSRMTQAKVTGRAVTASRLFVFRLHSFQNWCRKCRNWPSGWSA